MSVDEDLMSPELAAACEVEMFLCDRHNPLLRDRTKKWLRHNPERLNEFVASDYTRNPAHYRGLTYEERKEFYYWGWTPEQYEAERQAHLRMGEVMADAMYQMANREGFMRKLLGRSETYTVPEFTGVEMLRATRIARRNHKPKSEVRTIVRALRSAHVT